MCGICGVVGNHISLRGKQFFEQALVADTIRGYHSTGMVNVQHDLGYEWRKDTKSGADFIKESETKKLLNKYNHCVAMLGHNRAATQGSVTVDNAHPFHVGNIILMHNGTLWDTKELSGDEFYSVDSNVIAHSINEKGIEHTAYRMDGAFALVWYDLESRTINFCRNDERPLWFAKIKENYPKKTSADNMWVYGSELGMIEWLTERNKLEVEEFFELDTNKLLSFDASSNFEKPHLKHLEYRPFTPAKNYSTTTYPKHYQGSSQNHKPNKDAISEATDGMYSHEDYVEFWPQEFIPYEVQRSNYLKGKVAGWMTEHPFLEILVHGVEEPNVQLVSKVLENGEEVLHLSEGLYRAKVVSSSKGTRNEDMLIGNGSSIELWDDFTKRGSNIVPLDGGGKSCEDFLPGPNGVYIPVEEWMRRTMDGCANCVQPLNQDEAFEITWIDGNSPVCYDCAVDMHMIDEKQPTALH